MIRLLLFGEFVVAIIAALFSIVSFTIIVLLPVLVPSLLLTPVAIAYPSLLLNRRFLRWTLHLSAAINCVFLLLMFFAIWKVGDIPRW